MTFLETIWFNKAPKYKQNIQQCIFGDKAFLTEK